MKAGSKPLDGGVAVATAEQLGRGYLAAIRIERSPLWCSATVLVLACLAGVPLSAVGAVYPPNTWLQVGPVVIGVVLGWWALRRWPLSNASVAWVCAFILLHLLAARWTYSSVPYDAWGQAVFGFSIDAALGFERNMFDRLVHFASGLCFARALVEIGMADEVAKKAVLVPGSHLIVVAGAKGDAAIGITFKSAIVTTPGLKFAGTLPRPLEDREPFTAGVLKNAKEPAIAEAFVASLSGPEAVKVWTELGFAPGPAAH